jgi:hypothetical protein
LQFSTFKQDIEKRLDKLEQEGVESVKQLLKEWLTTGVGLLRYAVGNNGNLCINFTG